MKANKIPLSLGLPAALIFAAATMLDQDPNPAGATLAQSLAVVDLGAVLKAYPPALAREKEWAQMQENYNNDLREMEKKVEGLQALISGYNPGTEEHQKASLAWELARLEYEGTVKWMTRNAQRAQEEVLIDLYDEIRLGIAAFAKAQKLELVLRHREDPPGAGPKAVVEGNKARDVLYHADALDKTQAVILFLKQWNPPPKPR